jgi:preprotein translocase subunit SecA
MFFREADVEMKKMAESWKSWQSSADSQEIAGRGADTKSPKKIGRNAPCPCGSGLKYKKCCGKFS